MIDFKAPVEDIIFTLEHVLNASSTPSWDSKLTKEILIHFANFAENEIAPINEIGDVEGCRFDNGNVYLPKEFKQVYKSFVEQGWHGLTIPEKYDGQGMSAVILGAVNEIYIGACHSMQMITGLVPGAVRLLNAFGTDKQKDEILPLFASGNWLATMCLTEPSAGSDLSVIRSKASKSGGNWVIDGEKIFISGGGQDLSQRILHIVLARSGSLEDGVKGLSLFLCRSHDDDGNKNAVSVDRIEEKMGLHASPTCQLSFDNCQAELIGKEGEGLRAMFTLMNHARIDVGLQGAAHAARASHIAKSYAAERRQGRTAGSDGQVLIEKHKDVADMLMEQEALAMGSRAMCLYALLNLEEESKYDLVDFLTPICKSFSSEAGIRAADLGIQVLGGYGYLHEYRIEQIYRDARITSIYEGTNSIHGLTLASRLLKVENGAAANAFETMVQEVIDNHASSSRLMASLKLWQKKRNKILVENQPEENSYAFMKLSGLVAYQTMWLKIVAAANKHGNPHRLIQLGEFVAKRASVEARYWSEI
ncbi:MAG: acyl-CoA dehydrogenase [Hyphomicrobiales bacterium]|nr:MAG: acyl-CoA dehydrogenase [Hyphomicrobiales bacterium]